MIRAQNIIVNKENNETHFFVTIPFSQFFFSAETSDTQYQLSININDQKKKNVHRKTYNINLNKDSVIDDSAYLIDFSLVLEPGQYKMITLLRNINLGDKKEKQFDIIIDSESNAQNMNFILAEKADLKFIPSGFGQLTPDLKSCYLILNTSMKADSILIKITKDKTVSYVQIPLNSGFKYDLLPLIQTPNITDLELRFYSGNIAESYNQLLYQSNDEYKQKFSLKDQLQQIKYIANQNEWKTINQIAQKNQEGAIEYFWERHDNSPGSFNNDIRELFYERVLKADEMFTIHKKLPGWKSDRGRIFIKKGPPDDTAEETFPIGRYPYIIWYYYRDNTVYRFYDKTGFGNYKLEDEYYEN